MRRILALVLATGCSSENATGVNGVHVVIEAGGADEDGPIAWRSQYGAELSGVWFGEDAPWAIAGMDGQTCRLQYSTGSVDVDEDLGEGPDTVWDGFPTDTGVTVVVQGSDEIAVGDFPSGEVLWSIPAPSTLAARATADALVLLRDQADCAIEWYGPTGHRERSVRLLDELCDEPSLEISRAADVAWVAGGGHLMEITAHGGARFVASGADHVARDGLTGALYVAEDGGSEIRAVGAADWVVTVDGSIVGVDDLGPQGAVVVSVASEDGDRLVVLEGADGSLVIDAKLPRSAGKIVASDDGRALAMIGRSRTDFFELTSLGTMP
jgi:hypothetical protein